MSLRFSRLATGLWMVAAMVLTSAPCWAVFHGLGPSQDEWGLKYDVAVSDAGNGKLTVMFTLADEGRLKPIYSITLIAFSKQTDSQGGRSYDAKLPIELKATEDGKRAGQVQISKELANRALFRVLTLTVDGKRQTAGAAYYDIPLNKSLNKSLAQNRQQKGGQSPIAPQAPQNEPVPDDSASVPPAVASPPASRSKSKVTR